MNALQTSSPTRAGTQPAGALAFESEPQPLAPPRWDWGGVRRVLVVRLRSIGDTVLSTPSLYALRRFLPDAQIDLLLEDWVAPLLDGNTDVSRVLTVRRGSKTARLALVRALRAARYDVAYNLHGGTTAALLTRASGARHRVGYASYRFGKLHTHAAPPASALWRQDKTHSVEQQLGLPGWTGVPVTDRPATRLPITQQAAAQIESRLNAAGLGSASPPQPFALCHTAAAFDSKRWDARNFARVADRLDARGVRVVAVAAPGDREVVRAFIESAKARVTSFDDLALPEVSALAARAHLFVGNDSGIAHIAAAVGTPSVVVFGSSNIAHWRPWASAPSEVVREEMPCAPCAGYTCSEFGEAECIRRVTVERVNAAIERVLARVEG
ncbi:MAG TPA: glycosyltransferase family 9 protein [Pyrinomonadaceae bacterium]|nr:glycosyltransferase family 9 protein [Pyrinomonadaceae bacterium]